MDKDHGRIELRQLWAAPTEPQTMGLAGVAQVVRLRCYAQTVRQGKVIKESDDVRFAVTTHSPQEAGPDAWLRLARDHWSIENGQPYRRDRTQDEDRCPVRDPRTAWTLSLFRSLAIFLFQQQASAQDAPQSLPDLEAYVHRKPWSIIRRLTRRRSEQ